MFKETTNKKIELKGSQKSDCKSEIETKNTIENINRIIRFLRYSKYANH